MKYYHSGPADEIQAILRDGFTDITATIDGQLKRGVYITDAPGERDPAYPRDQLLEITLPPEIDLRKWRLVFVIPEKPCRWLEWIVPSDRLNTNARVRLLTSQEWEELWVKYIAPRRAHELMRAFDSLVRDGYLEAARDAQGQPIYRRGQPIYRRGEPICRRGEPGSEKGRQLEASGQEPPPPPLPEQ